MKQIHKIITFCLSLMLLVMVGGTEWKESVPAPSDLVFSLRGSQVVRGTEPYIDYQWALENRGYVVEHEIDDIHKVKKQSRNGFDIGWSNFYKKGLDKKLKKDVVVAILDSGVAYTHPELKDQLFKNEVECNGMGLPPSQPKDDRDQNGFKGDCLGWDFTKNETLKKGETSFSRGSQPLDDLGHGTHIAGILAATQKNNEGISGISSRIKILPIKVTFSGDNINTLSDSEYAPVAERMEKGIRYAILRKVDVINISLGWPKFIDRTGVRKAIAEALKSGISVVAAVGNNNHSSPIFPCSYPGVICVGSIDLDGKMSSFSNYGGQVDILAPGDHILSTSIQSESSLAFGGRKGYDIKSGTSQAAPHISAMVALLKSAYPEIGHNEILARLVQSSKEVDMGSKFVMDGLAKLDRLFENGLDKNVVRPIYKNLHKISYSDDKKSFKFLVPIKNYGKNPVTVEARLALESPAVRITSKTRRVMELKPGETQPLWIQGLVIDEDGDSAITLRTKIKLVNGPSKVFKNSLSFTKDIQSIPSVIERAVEGVPADLVTDLRQVSQRSDSPGIFELFRSIKDNDGLQVLVYRENQKKFTQVNAVKLRRSNSIRKILRIDLNMDGQKDYAVFSRFDDKESQKSFVSYLDHRLKPLFKGANEIPIDFGDSSKNGRWTLDSEFLPLATPYGTMKMPLFYQRLAKVPNQSRHKDPLEFIDEDRPSYQVLMMTLETKEEVPIFRVERVDTVDFYIRLRNELGLRNWQPLKVVHLFPATQKEYNQGIVRGVLAVESRNGIQEFVISFQGSHLYKKPRYGIDSTKYESGVLSGQLSLGLTDIRTGEIELKSGRIQATANRGYLGQAQMMGLDLTEIRRRIQFAMEDPSEKILGYIRGFSADEADYLFAQSTSYISGIVDNGGSTSVFTKNIVRSNFFPGTLFRESLYPVVATQDGNLRPGVFVDDTQVSSQHVYSWLMDPSGLYRPMKYDVSIPEKCLPLKPILWRSSKRMAYTFKCIDKEKIKFMFLPLD